MKFNPTVICVWWNEQEVLGPRHYPLTWIPDGGYDIYLPIEYCNEYPEFINNRVFGCISSFAEVPTWIAQHAEIPLIFQFSVHKSDASELLSGIRRFYSHLPHQKQLQLADCQVEDLANNPHLNELFAFSPEIIVLNEFSDGTPMSSGISLLHKKRRRPCRYPFECLSLDLAGNLFPCPSSCHCIATVKSFEEIKNSRSLLYFLASQLVLDLDAYPCCQKCEYWLDGWLGDENHVVKGQTGETIRVFQEGHSCRLCMEGSI